MKNITTKIYEVSDKDKRAAEHMLNDICQMWSNVHYDLKSLDDPKKLAAIKKFWSWAHEQEDDDVVLGSKQLKEFESIMNESLVEESKADDIEKKLKAAIIKAIEGIDLNQEGDLYQTLYAALYDTQAVEWSVLRNIESLLHKYIETYENE